MKRKEILVDGPELKARLRVWASYHHAVEFLAQADEYYSRVQILELYETLGVERTIMVSDINLARKCGGLLLSYTDRVVLQVGARQVWVGWDKETRVRYWSADGLGCDSSVVKRLAPRGLVGIRKNETAVPTKAGRMALVMWQALN